ncbi:hypothetical protein BDB00DRAFT_804439 [Zychaea mexicana]|uniref:uncharacterized protein n=1 Tax=Zychaea mexicana TaxID=64656 RepID=UPI0022FEC841|nr:uncharacterized protein BDB00DRAFT_804439 [Zychaea mexicana]KAI9497437.1 hypothetical protein BDB00DRAFT_804439 [Zychaea mexicana]
MSAFAFINATNKSKRPSLSISSTSLSPQHHQQQQQNLSASLADDFFSDQFASFVNQSSSSLPPSSPSSLRDRYSSNGSSHRRRNEAGMSSAYGHHEIKSANITSPSSTSSTSFIAAPLKKSAFSFIGASSQNYDKNQEDTTSATSTPRPQSPMQSSFTRKINNNNNNNARNRNDNNAERPKKQLQSSEINQLSAETTWRRLQAEKEREKDKIQRCYNKRVLIHEQIIQLQKEIQDLKAKAIEALDAEDYLQSQAFQTQQLKLTDKLWDIFNNTENQVEQQIHACWKTLADILAKETEAAKKLADACKFTKDERERQFLKYHIDNERKYEEKLQQINQQRGKIDEEKSEIAFDMEMWEQSNTEFKNKMDELVCKERSKKNALTRKMRTVQNEIDELMARLGELQQERDGYEAEIHQLDIVIHETTGQYGPEKKGLEDDYLAVHRRKQAAEKKSAQLDREDEMLYREMERHSKDNEKEKSELEALEKQIIVATEKLEQGQEEYDAVLTTFHEYVQSRDELVLDNKQAMVRAHQGVTARIVSIEAKRREAYAAQCRLEEQEGAIHQLKAQLGSLKRQKKLAVGTGQLQLAAEAAAQAKSIEATLVDSEAIRVDRQSTVDECLAQLREGEYQMETLKKECSDIQQKSGTEMITIFQKSKESMIKLKQQTLHPQLQLLVDLELANLSARILSAKCRLDNGDVNSSSDGDSDDKVDINLVSIDDDPPAFFSPSSL